MTPRTHTDAFGKRLYSTVPGFQEAQSQNLRKALDVLNFSVGDMWWFRFQLFELALHRVCELGLAKNLAK
jgi:hypothetical protein